MRMKGAPLSVLILAVLAAAAPPTASAQFGLPIPIPGFGGGPLMVYDPAAVGKLIDQIRSQLEQIGMQRQQLESQLLAMQKLQRPAWREIRGLVGQRDQVMQQGQALAYGLRTIDAEFTKTFPGVRVFQDFLAEEQAQVTRTLDTFRGVLNAASRAAAEVPDGLARLAEIKQQLTTVRGHEEALELNATVGVYGVEEMVLLRQALAAQTNLQAVHFARQVNAAAQERATFRANLETLAAPARASTPYSLSVEP
jgi:P-type conjugative transfer protein TrbJ